MRRLPSQPGKPVTRASPLFAAATSPSVGGAGRRGEESLQTLLPLQAPGRSPPADTPADRSQRCLPLGQPGCDEAHAAGPGRGRSRLPAARRRTRRGARRCAASRPLSRPDVPDLVLQAGAEQRIDDEALPGDPDALSLGRVGRAPSCAVGVGRGVATVVEAVLLAAAGRPPHSTTRPRRCRPPATAVGARAANQTTRPPRPRAGRTAASARPPPDTGRFAPHSASRTTHQRERLEQRAGAARRPAAQAATAAASTSAGTT